MESLTQHVGEHGYSASKDRFPLHLAPDRPFPPLPLCLTRLARVFLMLLAPPPFISPAPFPSCSTPRCLLRQLYSKEGVDSGDP